MDIKDLDNYRNMANEKFSIFTDIIDDIFYIFTTKYEISEVLLNFFFTTLVIIITVIIYWDSINGQVTSNSRCKRQLNIINNLSGEYLINARDKNNRDLFNITYNMGSRDVSIECACNTGDVINNFSGIPVKDIKNNRDLDVKKDCMCDKYYDTDMGSEIIYDGEPGILRYINSKDDTFFKNTILKTN